MEIDHKDTKKTKILNIFFVSFLSLWSILLDFRQKRG